MLKEFKDVYTDCDVKQLDQWDGVGSFKVFAETNSCYFGKRKRKKYYVII